MGVSLGRRSAGSPRFNGLRTAARKHFETILLLPAKRDCGSETYCERVARRRVDALLHLAARARPRFKEILRFKVFLVEQVVDGQIQPQPAVDLFGYRKVDHVVAARLDRGILAVEAVSRGVPPKERCSETP